MNFLLHYPGEMSLEKELDGSGTFFSMWIKLICDIEFLREYVDVTKFFSRFIVYINGVRIWNPRINCENGDSIVIVAVNKGSYVENNVTIKAKSHICTCCGTEKTFFYDINNIFERKHRRNIHGHMAFCKECFINEVKRFVYENISYGESLDGKIIDIGMSGERDSTIAAYFVTKYIKENSINAKIKGVYNDIGLGYYDSLRMKSALMVAEKYGFECKVNHVDIGMLDDFYKNNYEKSMETKYCHICTFLSGWRDVGEYKGEKVISVTGSRTLEDDFVAKIYGTYTDNSSGSIKKINILQGLSEDMISLFAAAKKIDYCIADCPIQNLSAQYYCRSTVLNPLKANSNWVFKQTKNDFLYSATPFGLISSYDKINYFSNTIIRSDLTWVDLSKVTKGNYRILGMNTLPDDYISDDALNNNYTIMRMESENEFIKKEASDFLGIISDESFQSKKIWINPRYKILLYRYVLLYCDSKTGQFYIRHINNLEEKILSYLHGIKNCSFADIISSVGIDQSEDIALFIYVMLRKRVFQMETNSNRNSKKMNAKISLSINDKECILEDIINSKSINLDKRIINYNNNIKSEYEIYVSSSISTLLDYDEHSEQDNRIFVHFGRQVTIYRGQLKRFVDEFKPIDISCNDDIEVRCDSIILETVLLKIYELIYFNKVEHDKYVFIIDKEGSKIDRLHF